LLAYSLLALTNSYLLALKFKQVVHFLDDNN